jgi:hypothetical protein
MSIAILWVLIPRSLVGGYQSFGEISASYSGYKSVQKTTTDNIVVMSVARVGNPVANRHKWRIGHESVATQPSFLQLVKQKIVKFRIKFSIFFS